MNTVLIHKRSHVESFSGNNSRRWSNLGHGQRLGVVTSVGLHSVTWCWLEVRSSGRDHRLSEGRGLLYWSDVSVSSQTLLGGRLRHDGARGGGPPTPPRPLSPVDL